MKVLLLILVIPIIGLSQSQFSNNWNSEIERRVNTSINNGIAIATIDSLGSVEYYNFGAEKNNSKVTENSTFEIASLSKTFTSTLYKHFEKNGTLSINQEIRSFIPDSLPEQIKQITFYQLLNHTSGLPKLPPDYWTTNWDNPFNDHTKQKFLTSLMVVKLDSSKTWNYSNLGYALLGLIADDLTNNNGIENIISLMDMKKTSATLGSEISTAPHNFGNEVENWDFPDFNRYMGGVKSSSKELSKYLKYQIHNNADFSSFLYNTNILINENDSLVDRGGWLVFYRNQEEVIWHNGISGGYNSFIGFNIQNKSGIVILSNSQNSITDLGLHYLSNSFPLNSPMPSLTVKIEEYINLQQLDSIKLAWETPDSIRFNKNPMDLYWLQCHYISKNNLEVALLLNGLLIDEYKDDWEIYFYRGKIYAMMGEYDLARKSYTKVNDLYPKNYFIHTLIQTLPSTK